MKFDPSQTALDGLQFQQAREIAAKHDRLGVGESVGSQFEQVLLHKVVEAMRKTIPESGLLTSESGNQMYDHLIAQAMSQAMAKAGGVGLGQKLNAHMGVGDPQMGLEELQGSMKMDMRMQRLSCRPTPRRPPAWISPRPSLRWRIAGWTRHKPSRSSGIFWEVPNESAFDLGPQVLGRNDCCSIQRVRGAPKLMLRGFACS